MAVFARDTEASLSHAAVVEGELCAMATPGGSIARTITNRPTTLGAANHGTTQAKARHMAAIILPTSDVDGRQRTRAGRGTVGAQN